MSFDRTLGSEISGAPGGKSISHRSPDRRRPGHSANSKSRPGYLGCLCKHPSSDARQLDENERRGCRRDPALSTQNEMAGTYLRCTCLWAETIPGDAQCCVHPAFRPATPSRLRELRDSAALVASLSLDKSAHESARSQASCCTLNNEICIEGSVSSRCCLAAYG